MNERRSSPSLPHALLLLFFLLSGTLAAFTNLYSTPTSRPLANVIRALLCPVGSIPPHEMINIRHEELVLFWRKAVLLSSFSQAGPSTHIQLHYSLHPGCHHCYHYYTFVLSVFLHVGHFICIVILVWHASIFTLSSRKHLSPSLRYRMSKINSTCTIGGTMIPAHVHHLHLRLQPGLKNDWYTRSAGCSHSISNSTRRQERRRWGVMSYSDAEGRGNYSIFGIISLYKDWSTIHDSLVLEK